ncbi:MAG: endonuclease/exonuclease/phosphatase family protein [Gemmatimonadota bacterium]
MPRSTSTVALLAAAAAALWLGSCGRPSGQVRVLTYNIHHGEGTDGRLDLARLATLIRSARPDVVALQEVDLGTERADRVDQAVELARLTGMNVAFGANLEFQGGLYGNAVLSPFPVARHRNHALPNPSAGEPRGALEVTLVAGEGDTLVVVSTHFDHQGQASREAAAAAINEVLGTGARPAILAGDLNATPDNQALHRLRERWVDTGREVAVTNPQPRPIDHVLYRPAARWRTVAVQVLADTVASDHQPVLVVLERRPPENP